MDPNINWGVQLTHSHGCGPWTELQTLIYNFYLFCPVWWGLWVCNPWCKWKRRTHTAAFIFFGFGHQEFFVHRTLVLGSTCGKSWICWIFFSWELGAEHALWPVCGVSHLCRLYCWSQWWFPEASRPALSPCTWPLQAGAHNLPAVVNLSIVPCVQGSARGLQKRRSASPFSLHLTLQNRCIITKPCIVVRWKNCLENQ